MFSTQPIMQTGLSSWDAIVVIYTDPHSTNQSTNRHLHGMLPHQQPEERPKEAYLRGRMDCGQGAGSPQTGIWSSGASAHLLPSTYTGPGGSLEQTYLRCGCKKVFHPHPVWPVLPRPGSAITCSAVDAICQSVPLLPLLSPGLLQGWVFHRGTPWVIPISWHLGKWGRSWDALILPSKNGP